MSWPCNRQVQLCDPNRALRLPSQPRRVNLSGNGFGCVPSNSHNNFCQPQCNNCGDRQCDRSCNRPPKPCCGNKSQFRSESSYDSESSVSESRSRKRHSETSKSEKSSRYCESKKCDESETSQRGKRHHKKRCCRDRCCVKAFDCLKVRCGIIRAKLTKTADKTAFVTVGEEITYSYELFNTGTAPIDYPVYISDDKLGGILFDCNYIQPCTSHVFTAVYVVTDEDVANKSITNVAKAFIQVSCDELVFTNEACYTLCYGDTTLTGVISQTQPPADSFANQLITVSLQVFNAGPTQANNVTLTLPYPLNVNQGTITTVGTGVVAGVNSIVVTFPTIAAGQNATTSFVYNAPAGSYTWLGFIASDTINKSCHTTLTSNTVTVFPVPV
jgi:hypothetical protein